MPCLLRQSLASILNGTTNSAIVSQTLWTIYLKVKTSNIPISLTTRLAVNPNLKSYFPTFPFVYKDCLSPFPAWEPQGSRGIASSLYDCKEFVYSLADSSMVRTSFTTSSWTWMLGSCWPLPITTLCVLRRGSKELTTSARLGR